MGFHFGIDKLNSTFEFVITNLIIGVKFFERGMCLTSYLDRNHGDTMTQLLKPRQSENRPLRVSIIPKCWFWYSTKELFINKSNNEVEWDANF